MRWTTAVQIARSCSGVTYEEWINLYYGDPPTPEQIETCCTTAYRVLLRNNVIEEGVVFQCP